MATALKGKGKEREGKGKEKGKGNLGSFEMYQSRSCSPHKSIGKRSRFATSVQICVRIAGLLQAYVSSLNVTVIHFLQPVFGILQVARLTE